MILECNNLKKENSLENCSFFVADSLTYGEDESYDMISANGFIEYISLDQLKDFLSHAHSILKPGGIIALGSRNRLFNLITLNEFTLDEYSEKRSVKSLATEACELASASSDFDIELFCQKESLVNFQEDNYVHPVTGIKVSQRFQYTPLQLSNLLKEHGFITKRLSGCNYHQLPLTDNSKDNVPPENSLNHIPYCSTFMIAGSKL
jgi:SAM-dependent methyltransferase